MIDAYGQWSSNITREIVLTEKVPENEIDRSAKNRVRYFAHQQTRHERSSSIDPTRSLPRFPQPPQRVNLEDDSVHPNDGNEEEEEDGEHSVL